MDKLNQEPILNDDLILEHVEDEADPLKIDIDDEDLVEICNKRLRDSRSFFKNKINLYDRRKKNEIYFFGRQVLQAEKEGKLKDYSSRNIDNVLWEISGTIKPLAMSQLPDLIVTPGNNSDQSVATAKLLTKAVDTDVKRRNNRNVLSMSFKHRPIYFLGVIKCVWNPQLCGGLGDYEFLCIHPDNIELDHTCTTANAEKMKFVSQLSNDTVETLFMLFPDKKEELKAELEKSGISIGEEKKWKNLATPVDYREIWFDTFKKVGGEGEKTKYEKVSGVLWKYGDVILNKKKNPNFDYEGEEQVFTYNDPRLESSKRPLSVEEMQASMLTGQYPANIVKKKVYHNYFSEPHKPFFFMTYDQWGKQPMDESSDFEQNVNSQKSLDTRLQQIEDTLNNRGHHVWSKESGLDPSDVSKMDHNNPDEDYIVAGNVRDVHEFIPPERPTSQEFNEMDTLRNRMFSLSGSNATRGQLQSETATSNQIAREANYTKADDLVDDTINAAAEWMAGQALQMIKLHYTREHFRQILGEKGETVFVRLHQDMVQDGMEVMIKASGTDKIKAKNDAQENARLQLTDPLTYFTDMGYGDAEERTVKLLMFTKDPITYLKQFVENTSLVTDDLIQRLQAITAQQQIGAGVAGQGAMPPMPPQPTAPVNPNSPQVPTAQNTAAVPTQQPQVPNGSPRLG